MQGPFGIPIPPDFNPTRLATKALAIGTVLCLSIAGGTAFIVGRAMGVKDLYEFVDEVRAWAPRKRRELEAWAGLQVCLYVCGSGWRVLCGGFVGVSVGVCAWLDGWVHLDG